MEFPGHLEINVPSIWNDATFAAARLAIAKEHLLCPLTHRNAVEVETPMIPAGRYVSSSTGLLKFGQGTFQRSSSWCPGRCPGRMVHPKSWSVTREKIRQPNAIKSWFCANVKLPTVKTKICLNYLKDVFMQKHCKLDLKWWAFWATAIDSQKSQMNGCEVFMVMAILWNASRCANVKWFFL